SQATARPAASPPAVARWRDGALGRGELFDRGRAVTAMVCRRLFPGARRDHGGEALDAAFDLARVFSRLPPGAASKCISYSLPPCGGGVGRGVGRAFVAHGTPLSNSPPQGGRELTRRVARERESHPSFCRASFAPAPSAINFASAISRRIGAMPQLVVAMMLLFGTNLATASITFTTSSAVSTVSLATSITPA